MKCLSGFCFWRKMGEGDLILNNLVCLFASDKLWRLNWTVFRVPGCNCIHPLEQIWMTYSDCDAWDIDTCCLSCVAVACGLEITQLTADAPISSVSRHSKKDGNQSETITFCFFSPDVDPFGAEVRNLCVTAQANISVASDPCRLATRVALPRH